MRLLRFCSVFWWICVVLTAAEPHPICAGCSADIVRGESHSSTCPYRPQSSPTNRAKQRPTPQNLNQAVTLGLLEGLLNGLEQSEAQEQAQAAEAQRQAEAQRLAQEEARRLAKLAEMRRLAGLVEDQRRRRDSEGQDSLESLSTALGAGFDRPFAGAEPTGDPLVVDLRDRRGLVIPGLDAPAQPVTKAEVADARAAAAQRERLRRMAEEAEDSKALYQRLTDLEARLVAARARLVALKRQGNYVRREMDNAREEIEAAVASSLEHAMSLATLGVDKLHGAGLEKVKRIKSNQALWNETVRSADGVNEVLGKIREADDNWQWLTAERDPVKDLDQLSQRFELVSTHVAVGKIIVGSGVNLWREWKAAKAIAAAQPALQELDENRRRESAAQEQLIADTRAARAALARRLGIPLSQVPLTDPAPPERRGLGSQVPHPYD